MQVHAAVMLIAALMLSGTVLAQSSGPSAGGPAGGGQGPNVTTTGQALNRDKKTGDSGPPPIEKAARPAKPDAGASGNTVGVNRGPKTDRRNEHYP
ncbi:hypothetical protein AS156_12505 [Bradyrhizobium macuxiense]|uniref:Uncharacterized protein n=1 Tax=Bradyrhizobium macuxiense TaxID=1755647 RepID=A0A109JM85_9BRAD|nr:hypothetical protein AS156_12505 [Bradyrhizobium macuxiense]